MKDREWQRSLSFFGNRCAYCGRNGKGGKLSKDHIWPRHYGGVDMPANVIPACSRCNSSKGKKNVLEWYKKQYFFSIVRLVKIMAYVVMRSKV